jgi:hypothetical protein
MASFKGVEFFDRSTNDWVHLTKAISLNELEGLPGFIFLGFISPQELFV